MRLLHPTTITLVPKLNLSHAWSEVFKFYGGGKTHPKMFLPHSMLGVYMEYLARYCEKAGVNIDRNKIPNIQNKDFQFGYMWSLERPTEDLRAYLESCYPKEYLFSDCVSLYYKGINIFPEIYSNWRTLIPVESLHEIARQVNKTLG